MNKVTFLLPTILLISLTSFSQIQNQRCDTLILDNHSQEVLNIKENTIIEYLVSKGVNKEYLSNRDSLKLLKTLLCNSSAIVIFDTIKDKTLEVTIVKTEMPFDPAPYYYMPLLKNDGFIEISSYKENIAPYGFLPSDKVVDAIKYLNVKVNGKEIEVPEEVYRDLLFPNLCYTNISIKPIQAYLSKEKDMIYIYIFGEYRQGANLAQQNMFPFSYMAKIIISLSDGFQDRIVVRGNKLCYYNWDNCFDFIGF